MTHPSEQTYRRARCIEDWCAVPKDHVELAIMQNEEPGCEVNIGRLVAVMGEEVKGVDGGYWLPVRPMDQRPWTLINDLEQVALVEPRQFWVRLHDLFSTQYFLPESLVPGVGNPAETPRITGGESDDNHWRCKPGDLVMVVHAPWLSLDEMTPDMKAQLGRIGLVQEREAGGYSDRGWCWSVRNLSGAHWQNQYSFNGQPYTVEEPAMFVSDDRLLPLQWVPSVETDEEA